MVRTIVNAGPAETLTLSGQLPAAVVVAELLFAVVLGGVQRGHA
jgi:hypothetical protein